MSTHDDHATESKSSRSNVADEDKSGGEEQQVVGAATGLSEKGSEPTTEQAALVDWEGPGDPESPLNWPSCTRMTHVLMASAPTLLANVTTTAFAPAAGSLQREFGITDKTVGALTVSIYLLGYGFGPLLIAPLSEHYGRLPIYHVCMTTSIAFLVGCSQATNTGMFLAFRFLNGVAASGPGTVGAGTIADVMPPEQRGRALGIFSVGPLLGPVLGPIMGGFVSQKLDWRWVFRIIYIATAVMAVAMLMAMRETYGPVLLKRKAERIRKETENLAMHTRFEQQNMSPLRSLWLALQRPTYMLIFSPITLLLSLYCAFVFGLLYLLFTTFASVFSEQYNFSTGVSGLAYLGVGLGMAVGVALFSILSDRVASKKQEKASGEPWKPERRLLLMVWLGPVLPLGFFWYGWSAYYKTHWMVPLVGTGFIGIGSLMIMMPIQVYLVDAFGPRAAASALAANTVLRSIAGSFLPLAGPAMYAALGLAWGNSLLGFIAIGFTALPVLFYRYGEGLRQKYSIDF